MKREASFSVLGLLGLVALAASFAQMTGPPQPLGPLASTTGRTDRDWNHWTNPPHMFSIPNGNIGVGANNPSQKLEVAGIVFASAGGFMFPDGTVQSTAAVTTSYAQVYTVALSGGDFTTIGAAIAACAAPGPGNRYLVRVMPGTYVEPITCLSWVNLEGAGKYATVIQGPVMAADDMTLRDFEITEGVYCFGVSPTISNNLVTSNVANGIYVTDGGRPWIVENQVQDSALWGIHCDGWGTDAWIVANKIERNASGGIRCTDSSPTISNNQILDNELYGIYLAGQLGFPAEPTIDDNVIGLTDPDGAGVGIYMIDFAEPRIHANDIYVNYTGIEIQPQTQPSVLANNINYNHGFGIQAYSNGASKPVVIKGNHIHSNPTVGVDIAASSPIVTHNDVINNGLDFQYVGPPFPMISLNVFDTIVLPGSGATGLFNVTSLGLPIAP